MRHNHRANTIAKHHQVHYFNYHFSLVMDYFQQTLSSLLNTNDSTLLTVNPELIIYPPSKLTMFAPMGLEKLCSEICLTGCVFLRVVRCTIIGWQRHDQRPNIPSRKYQQWVLPDCLRWLFDIVNILSRLNQTKPKLYITKSVRTWAVTVVR